MNIWETSSVPLKNQLFLKISDTIHPDNKARGGSAIVTKEPLNYYEENKLQREDIQLTVVGIYSTQQKLKISAWNNYKYHSISKPTYWLTDIGTILNLLNFFITTKICSNSI